MNNNQADRHASTDQEALDLNDERLILDEAVAVAVGCNLSAYRASNERDIRKMLRNILEGANYEYIDSHHVEPEFQVARKADLDLALQRSDFAEQFYTSLASAITLATLDHESTLDLCEDYPPSTDYEEIRFTGKSFTAWAKSKDYILPFRPCERIGTDHEPTEVSDSSQPTSSADISWEHVTLTINSGYKITAQIKGQSRITKLFSDVGLQDRRKNQPNNQGEILIQLATKKPFGAAAKVPDKERTAISKLGKALKDLVDINDNPFQHPTPDKGYLPKFTLRDSRNDARERTKRHAIETSYDDSRSYVHENDAAGKFLRERDE